MTQSTVERVRFLGVTFFYKREVEFVKQLTEEDAVRISKKVGGYSRFGDADEGSAFLWGLIPMGLMATVFSENFGRPVYEFNFHDVLSLLFIGLFGAGPGILALWWRGWIRYEQGVINAVRDLARERGFEW